MLFGSKVTGTTALLGLALALSSLSSVALAAEKQIGQPCSSDQNSADFDTIAQCQSGTFVRAPLFMGTATGYVCTGGANAGLVRWNGSAVQVCNGTGWVGAAAGGSIDDLSDAATDYTTYYNMFLGSGTGAAITTGAYDTGLGNQALYSNTTGSYNTALGYHAGKDVTSGNNNIAIGSSAYTASYFGGAITGSYNVAIGNSTLNGISTENSNVAIGHGAAAYVSGTEITAIGTSALGGGNAQASGWSTVVGAASWHHGTYNSIVGAEVGVWSPGTGNSNSIVGYQALFKAGAADNNAVLGSRAGHEVTTGANNTIVGYSVGSTTLSTGFNNILIGTSSAVDTPSAGTNNWLNLGGVIFGATASATPQVAIGSGITSLVSGIAFDVGSLTTSIRPAVGTTAAQPTCAGTTKGAFRFDTDKATMTVCDGTAWNALGATSGVLLGTATGATNPQRSGDVTTGLFSPAASTVAIATAGVEALRVTATGSVGIGTAAPLTNLQITGSEGIYSAGTTSVGSPVGASLYLGDGNFAVSGYYNSAPGLSAVFDNSNSVGNVASALAFYSYAGASNSRTERMRISNGGSVGIGTAAPNAPLHVVSPFSKTDTSYRTVQRFTSNDAAASNPFGLDISIIGGASLAARAISLNTSDMNLSNGGSIVLQPSGGNVGIGTSSPASVLEVQLSGIGAFHVSGGNDSWINFNDGNNYLGGDTYFRTALGVVNAFISTTGGDTYFGSTSGNVGIGTTAPKATLDVNGYARLAKQSAQPASCSATNDGAIALTSQYTFCACKGGSTSWVRTTDGATACTW